MKDEPIIKENVTLENSELRKIADRVVDTAILAAQKVSVEQELEPEKESFESIFKERLKTFDTKKMRSIQERITPIYNASPNIKTGLYGELGKIDLEKVRSVEAEVQKLEPVKINPKLLGLAIPPKGIDVSDAQIKNRINLKADLQNFYNITSIDAITGGGRFFNSIGDLEDDNDLDEDNYIPQAVTDKLALYITRVKCVDETGAWWAEGGSDEIALAGVSVDENGDTKKIGERKIGGGFDDGDSKSYNPHWQWTWFSMREGGNKWPKSYFLNFILAEKDNRGLTSFLQKLWEKVREQVLTFIGSFAGSFFGPLGTIIGAAVGYAVGKIVDWFIKSWKDDIFRPQTISCTCSSYEDRFSKYGRSGYTTSNKYKAHFSGHNGHYYIEYYWRLLS